MKKIAKSRSKIGLFLKRKLTSKLDFFLPEEIADFAFFQFKQQTAEFFFDKHGKTDIRITDTPHYAFAKSLESGSGIQSAKAFYEDYLSASWGDVEKQLMSERVNNFQKQFEYISTKNRYPRVNLTRLIPSSPYMVLDGNHRCAINAALGRPIKGEVLPPDLAIKLYAKAPEFYGLGNGNLPYQDIYLSNQVVIGGRRSDLIERINLIPQRAITDCRILDIASNMGMSSSLAYKNGAKYCKGLELSLGMVNFATKLSMFDSLYPNVQFSHFDIDNDTLDDAVFDTAFAFSIFNHLKKPESLLRIIEKNVQKYLIFEGHPGDSERDYEIIFNSGIFRDIELLGTLYESNKNRRKNRKLWMCII